MKMQVGLQIYKMCKYFHLHSWSTPYQGQKRAGLSHTLLLHMPALFKGSLKQTAGPKMAAHTAMFSQLSNVHFFTIKMEKVCPNLLCIIFFIFHSTLSAGPMMLLRFGSALSSFCSTKSLAFWQQPAAGGAFKAIF